VLNNDYEGQVCSIARTLETIGERWTILVIREVLFGRRKFTEIQRNLGVARNVLTNRLQRLVDAGILERRVYSEKPERFHYYLTEKGLDLWPTIVSLMHWGDKHLPLPDGPPVLFVHRGECGGAINDHRICERCGEAIEVRDSKAVEGPGLAAARREAKAAQPA